ncbi:hypothetical protein CA85_22280 [Allorhodopirellula solitaria]|uniref:Uncharacterized protein n=1 Tax=Allorhodopirellula solitaria TaxID=2527987 RepID=A0A5C5XXF0_9BACT|nr:hypothetical protein CA85_22280 [Allorhodopirellula solitaria]
MPDWSAISSGSGTRCLLSSTRELLYANDVEESSRWSSAANTTGNAEKHACQPQMEWKIIYCEVRAPLRGRRSIFNSR